MRKTHQLYAKFILDQTYLTDYLPNYISTTYQLPIYYLSTAYPLYIYYHSGKCESAIKSLPILCSFFAHLVLIFPYK